MVGAKIPSHFRATSKRLPRLRVTALLLSCGLAFGIAASTAAPAAARVKASAGLQAQSGASDRDETIPGQKPVADQQPANNESGAADKGSQSAPPGPACIYAPFADLIQRSGHLPRRALLMTTKFIGAGSQTEMALPAGEGTGASTAATDFRAFFVTPEEEGRLADISRYSEWRPTEGDARIIQQQLPKDVAERLHLDSTKNELMQLDVPAAASDGLWYQTRHLIIFACLPGRPEPVLRAELRDMGLSPVSFPIAAGLLFAALIYLSAATFVYIDRKKQASFGSSSAEQAAGPAQPGAPVVQPAPAPAVPAVAQVAPAAAAAPPEPPMQPLRIDRIEKWSWWKCLIPVVMTSDIFDRGSLSKFQILFFTLLVAYGLMYIITQTGELSSISTSVVYLLGISALGALGTQVTATRRDRFTSENWAYLVSRDVLPLNDPGKTQEPRWADLVMSDAELDLYKLQALTFSVIVGVAMIAGGFQLATFSVPQELLEILGLSQLVFVGGRLAKPQSVGDIDDLVTELRKREGELRRAAASGVDVDADGKPVSPGQVRAAVDAQGNPVPTSAAAPSTSLEAVKRNVPNAWRRYQDTANQIRVLLSSLAHRKVKPDALSTPALV